MFRYIKQADVEKLIQDDRIAWVIYNVDTKDKEEYINNSLEILKGYGCDTNILNQCSVFKTNGTYNIVVSVRKQAKASNTDIMAMNRWAVAMGNVKTAEQFIRDYYSGKIPQKQNDSITCHIATGSKKKDFTAIIRFKLNNSGDIVDAMIVSPKFIDIHGKKLDVTSCERNIPKVVERFYGMIYKRYGYNIDKCRYIVDGKILKYKVLPTQSGIKLDLIS